MSPVEIGLERAAEPGKIPRAELVKFAISQKQTSGQRQLKYPRIARHRSMLPIFESVLHVVVD